MLRKGMFLGDRYEILDQIGTGGMSDVYKAKCHKLNRFVAIKVLKQEFSEDAGFVSKFKIEAQSAAGLIHPNIVNVYDVGDEDGIHYIVMELVEGITLKRYIEKKGHLSVKEAVSIAIQVAQGMETAHSHKIIHRDIKPQNIIISKEGKVKVTDFGIARASSSHTINSAAMGSVHYISPEQARGGYSDEKSDIYSFGITLYEMLTGTVPFDGDNTVAVAVQHIQEEITPPSAVTEGIPVSVDKIVLKCTQKKVDRRYQNVTELIADLKKSLVMPDVDFVKMMPVYGAAASAQSQPGAGMGIKTDMFRESGEERDDFDPFDEEDLLSGEEDEFDEDDDDLREEDNDGLEDVEDEHNERLDTIMKWMGIGIAALFVVIVIFVVVKLAGIMNTGDSKQSSAPAQSQEQSSSIDMSDYREVPPLKGLTEEEAKAALNRVELGCKVTYQPSDTVPAGRVISQGQKEGAKVPKNTTITISVSEGLSTTVLLNVTGKTEAEAEAMLAGMGLGLIIDKDYEYSETVEQGKVISQLPVANTSIRSGSTVKIIISRGPEVKNIKLPSVIGKTESQARQELEKAGVSAGKIKRVVGAAAPDKARSGLVYQQNPAGGTTITSEDEITITIYQDYKEPESSSTGTQQPSSEPSSSEPSSGNAPESQAEQPSSGAVN